jgi:hypothetical protein
LQEMRERKVFEGHCADWGEFCEKYLHISKTNANRIIHLLEEFGAQYFEVAQLTRISPETYRAIAPAIQDGALHAEGEAIALIPENAEKVAAAVAAVRKKERKPTAEPPAPTDPVTAVIERGTALADEMSALSSRYEDRPRLANAIGALRLRLERIQRTL